jgi:hypothetical protein
MTMLEGAMRCERQLGRLGIDDAVVNAFEAESAVFSR